MVSGWMKVALLVIAIHFIREISSQCCSQIGNGDVCISCPTGMHLYRDNCIFDLQGCLQYDKGFDCSQCKQQYLLQGGQCIHPKISPQLYDNALFTNYLQSSLKPDNNLATVRETIETDILLWMQWLNSTLINYNNTLLTRNNLQSNATLLRNKIIRSNSTPILEYIHIASNTLDNICYLFYRFTYNLIDLSGYADLLVSVELLNNTINYLELSSLNISELTDSNWTKLTQNDVCLLYVQNILSGIFGEIINETFLKGFTKSASTETTFNLFYMSNNKGVINYLYEASNQQLPKTTKSQTPLPNNNPSNLTIETNTSTNNTSKLACNSSNAWIVANVSDLSDNMIFMTGYAVAVQQQHVPITCSITQLFYKHVPPTYAMFLSDTNNSTNITAKYYKFVFRINEQLNQFQVVNFHISNKTFPPFLCINENNTTNSSNNNNSNITRNEKINKTNQTQSVSNITTKDKNSTLMTNSSSNTNTVDNPTTNCQKLTDSVDVDITTYQKTDIFLPKINLLLRTMYTSLLVNSNLTAAYYSWTLDNNNIISNIAYTIIYQDLKSITLAFIVNISHNQIQFVSLPSNITQDGITQNNSNNNGNNQNIVKNSSSDITQAKDYTIITNISNNTASTEQTNNTKTSENNTTNQSSNSPTLPISYKPIALNSVANEPKYQSLVMILRYLFQLPNTTIVQDMEQYQDNTSNCYYLVVFHTQMIDNITNNPIIKINSYSLEVNASGFVSILNSKIQYIQNTSYNNLNTKPRQLSYIQAASLHFTQIISLFELHSPQLRLYQASSFQCKLLEYKIGKNGKIFKEVISFKGTIELCYEVYYRVFTNYFSSFINQQYIEIISYNLISCNDAGQNQINDHLSADFIQTSTFNPKINSRILTIIKQAYLSIESYKKYLNFYQIKLITTSGHQQIIIDLNTMIVLAYRKTQKIIYEPSSLNTSKLLNTYTQIIQANES